MNNQALCQDHFETQVEIDAPPAEVFDLLDDQRRLSAHMMESSWMMAGSRMTIDIDEKLGRAVGSKITLSGRVLGLSLIVEEVVTTYDPPSSKSWQTIGSPRLLVIGPYRMGFSLSPLQGGSLLRVFIDYSLPGAGASGVLGRVFGRAYAKWCTNRMARDAAKHFQTRQGST
jgi:hypothetical protein